MLVISHDPALNPDLTRDNRGQFLQSPGPDIISLSWAQLQTYDVGQIKPGSRYAGNFPEQKSIDGTRIPRLQDLFDQVKAMGNSQVQFAIETKLTPTRPEQTPDPESFVHQLLKVINDNGMQARGQIQSFDWRTLQAVQRLAPDLPTVYLTAQLPNLDNIMARSGSDSHGPPGFSSKPMAPYPA